MTGLLDTLQNVEGGEGVRSTFSVREIGSLMAKFFR